MSTEQYEPRRLIELADVRRALYWADEDEYVNRYDHWLADRWQEFADLGYDFERRFDFEYWQRRTAEAWEQADPQTPEEIITFYRTLDLYIPHLSAWTFEGDKIDLCRRYYEWFVEPVDGSRSCRTFLDYGSGVGDVTLWMNNFADAYYCDVGGVLETFYRRRTEARSLDVPDPVRVEGPDWQLSDRFDEELDVVVTNDVLEHVPDPAATVRGLVDAVRPGGHIVTQWTFNDSEPLHIHVGKSPAREVLNVLRAHCDELYSTWNAFARLWRKRDDGKGERP